MSKLHSDHVFTSESVSEGHPDKVCDQVSDAILDACLAQDPCSRVACETAVTTNLLVNIGEITCEGWDAVDPEAIAHQTADVPLERIREDLIQVARDELGATGLLSDATAFYINPTGKFVIGGPHGDAGLTGRKIIVDTYGGVGCHGGGAFSGKDPSKVDRSAAYYARYAAKNVVAAGLADKCEIQVAYAIGVARPLSINVDTFGTGHAAEADIEAELSTGDLFDFRPASIIRDLELTHPKGWSYRDTSVNGHFGWNRFPWERTDKAEALRDTIGPKERRVA